MADNTPIEWTDASWSPITGCSVVSPGCTNCYAMRWAGTRLKHTPSRAGLTIDSKAGPVWNGQVRLNADQLTQPLRWKRPRRIFVCAHGDLFHESVPDAWIDQVFAVMALSPQHTFQVLTKRAERMRDYMLKRSTPGMIGQCALDFRPLAPRRLSPWPLPNVHLGVSAEDQTRADERIPHLLATPAAVRFLSAEPLLGPIELRALPWRRNGFTGDVVEIVNGLTGEATSLDPVFVLHNLDEPPGLDWVIVGGESGPDARPMHPDWARQIRDACAAAGVPFFFKQWGAWAHRAVIDGVERADPARFAYMNRDGDRDRNLWAREDSTAETDPTAWWFERVGKKAAGRTLDGVTHDAMPGSAAHG